MHLFYPFACVGAGPYRQNTSFNEWEDDVDIDYNLSLTHLFSMSIMVIARNPRGGLRKYYSISPRRDGMVPYRGTSYLAAGK